MTKCLRVGLYARASTHDQQTLSLQVDAMHTYVTQRGWTVVTEAHDIGSGAIHRPQRERLMQTAR
jgi:putative DNA-invertase from lambdoid prophage Rac